MLVFNYCGNENWPPKWTRKSILEEIQLVYTYGYKKLCMFLISRENHLQFELKDLPNEPKQVTERIKSLKNEPKFYKVKSKEHTNRKAYKMNRKASKMNEQICKINPKACKTNCKAFRMNQKACKKNRKACNLKRIARKMNWKTKDNYIILTQMHEKRNRGSQKK